LDQKKFERVSNLNSILFELFLTRLTGFKPSTVAIGPTCRRPTFVPCPTRYGCRLLASLAPVAPAPLLAARPPCSSACCQPPCSLSAAELREATPHHPTPPRPYKKRWSPPVLGFPFAPRSSSNCTTQRPLLAPLTPCLNRIAGGTSAPLGLKPNAVVRPLLRRLTVDHPPR
jgi:hypothetical protein